MFKLVNWTWFWTDFTLFWHFFVRFSPISFAYQVLPPPIWICVMSISSTWGKHFSRFRSTKLYILLNRFSGFQIKLYFVKFVWNVFKTKFLTMHVDVPSVITMSLSRQLTIRQLRISLSVPFSVPRNSTKEGFLFFVCMVFFGSWNRSSSSVNVVSSRSIISDFKRVLGVFWGVFCYLGLRCWFF